MNFLIQTFSKFKSQAQHLARLSSRRSLNLLWISTAVGICMALIEFGFAFYLQNFFAVIGVTTRPTTMADLLPTSVYAALMALLGMGLLRFIFQSLKIFSGRMAQQEFGNSQRSNIIEKHLRYAKLSSSSESLALFNDEVQRGSVAFLNLSFLLIAFSSCIILFISLLFTNASAALSSLVFLAILYFPSRLINNLTAKEGKSLSHHWARVNSFFIDGIRNNFYLKLYNQVDSTIEMAKSYLGHYLESYRRTFILLSVKTTFPTFVGLILVCLVALVQTRTQTDGNNGSLLIFFYLFLRFTQEAATTMACYSELLLNGESLRKISLWNQKMLPSSSQPQELEQDTTHIDGFTLTGIECHKVNFGYQKHHRIVQDLDLKLSKGDCLVITGPSGKGKSTLLSLLLGLEEPESGTIRINNQYSIPQIKSAFLERVGYVGPVPFIIAGTVKDNLLYAHPHPEKVRDEVILNCLKKVFLYDHIQSLTKGLQSPLDETAATFSAGQKQRLMFARALIRQPEILVLDEATANLDHELEEKLVENLRELKKDLIIIAVSHSKTISRIQTQEIRF
jgi:ABC-type multidrug transport system fused ATPase/permease subunit